MSTSTHSSPSGIVSTCPDNNSGQESSSYCHSLLAMSSGQAAFKFSPEKLKEYLIEFCEMESIHGMVDDMDFKATLLGLSSLAVESPEDVTMRSMASILHTRVQAEAREVMLYKTIVAFLTDKSGEKMRAAVERLMDEEMESRGITFKSSCGSHNYPVVVKARMIVRHMAQSIVQRGDFRTSENEFEVNLGMSFDVEGKNFRSIRLHFSYGTPFEHFLGALRDGTVHCIEEPGVTVSSRGYTITDGPWVFQVPMKELAREVCFKTGAKLNGSQITVQETPQIANQPLLELLSWSRDQKESKGGNPEIWHFVSDEFSYHDMLINIKKSGGKALFWHLRLLCEQINETRRSSRMRLGDSDFNDKCNYSVVELSETKALQKAIEHCLCEKLEADRRDWEELREIVDEYGQPFLDKDSYMEYLSNMWASGEEYN